MTIEFIKAGLQSSIQDDGFKGQMKNGIAQCGAMDPVAMKLANWLVSKPLNSAVLEITLIGPELKFSSAMQIAICGAQFNCYLNGENISNNETIQIESGDIVEFKKLNSGARAYLAFSGELELKQFLESRSTNITCNFGGLTGHALKPGDKLRILNIKVVEQRLLPVKLQPYYSNHLQLRVTPGMEENWFSDEQEIQFYTQTYEISSESSRMGLRLKSQPILTSQSKQLISSGIVQGSIQLPDSGQAIITSVEGQTIGGYPRIANVIQADLHLLGQLSVNHRIDFQKISIKKAQHLWQQKTHLLECLNNN